MGKTSGGRGTHRRQIEGRSAGSSHVPPEAEDTLPGPPPHAMAQPKITLTRNDIEVLLDELDDEMSARGVTGNIELVGGAAMALAHYDRVATTDVDDIAVLLRACDITTLEQAQALMDDMYDGEHEISERGQRMVLGALGARSIEQASGEPLELEAVAPVRRSECGKLDFRTNQRCAQPVDHDGDCA